MTGDAAYFDSQDFKDILQQYEESVKSGHTIYMDADDLADIADYYQFKGHAEEAEEAISLALQYNPDAIGPLLYRTREAMNINDFDTAREFVKHIKSVDRQEALYVEGEIMICEGKAKEANEFYREQMKDIMNDELTDYVFDVANIFSEYSYYEIALEWMLRSQGDDSDEFKELMARTLFGLGKYQESERIFNELIDHNPYSVTYWNALASAQFMREDYGASITSSEYAIAINPNDPESLLSKANGLYNLGNYESAYTYFKRYSEQVDDDEFGYLYQGTCLINLGHFEEAIDILQKAAETAHHTSQYLADIYQELAFGYSELHNTETALYYLELTRDLECDHVNIEIIKGHVLLVNNQMEEAKNAFREALILSEEPQKTMLRIIISLYDNKFVHTSYNIFKGLLKNVDTDWNEGYSYMALCCMDLNKQDEFLYYLKLATEKNPKEARIVLGSLFPEDISPEEYYHYTINKLKRT